MDGKFMSASPVDFSDIQGLVRFAFGALTEASFLLLQIRDADAARTWLESAPVTTAEKVSPPPATALQVAFTREGLQALGIAQNVLAGILCRVSLGYDRTREPLSKTGGCGGKFTAILAMGWDGKCSASCGDALCKGRCSSTDGRRRSKARGGIRRSKFWIACKHRTCSTLSPLDSRMESASPHLTGNVNECLKEINSTMGILLLSENSCSAIPMNMASTPTGLCSPPMRLQVRSCRLRRTNRTNVIWDATALSSWFGNCSRMFVVSGDFSIDRPMPILRHDRTLPNPWWVAGWMALHSKSRVRNPLLDSTKVRSQKSIHLRCRQRGNPLSVRRAYPKGKSTQRRPSFVEWIFPGASSHIRLRQSKLSRRRDCLDTFSSFTAARTRVWPAIHSGAGRGRCPRSW